MHYRREGNESSCVRASDPLLETERSKIVVKYKCSLCRQVMAVREALHAECGQLLCSKCVTWATRYSLFCRINFIKFNKVACFHDSWQAHATRNKVACFVCFNSLYSNLQFPQLSQGTFLWIYFTRVLFEKLVFLLDVTQHLYYHAFLWNLRLPKAFKNCLLLVHMILPTLQNLLKIFMATIQSTLFAPSFRDSFELSAWFRS